MSLTVPSARASRLLPDLVLLAAALIWGSTFAIVKEALDFTSPAMFLLLRFGLAFAIITPGILPWKRADKTAGEPFLKITRREWVGGILTGVALFIGFTFQTWGLVFTSASRSAFITGLNVLLVPFLLWGLGHQKISRRRWIGVLFASVGLYLLIDPSSGSGINRGDLFTLVCAVAFAVQIILLSIYSPSIDTMRYFWVQLLTIVVLSVIVVAATGQADITSADPLWFGLGITGILGTAGAFLGMTWAQKHVSPTRTALYLAMEPVFGAIYAVLLAGESLTALSWFGGLLIVGVIIVSEFESDGTSSRGVSPPAV